MAVASVVGRGKRVTIIQYSSNSDGSCHSALILADGFKRAGWITSIVFGFEGPMISAFRRNGHEVLVASHKNWLRSNSTFRFCKNTLRELCRVPSILQIYDKLKPDVVYINTLVSLAAAVAAKVVNIPVVWHIRELFSDVGGEMRIPKSFSPLVRKTVTALSTAVIVNSGAVRKNILGIDNIAAHTVPNAVDSSYTHLSLNKLESRQQLNISPNKLVLGVPGTLRPMKGHDFFLRAISTVLPDNPNLDVIISGEGEPTFFKQLQSLVTNLGIAGRVTFLGQVEDMKVFYGACDLVVIPSRAEPFGRVVIEAFASRVPVIATRVGGIPEIIEDGRNGVLIPYGDEKQLRNAIHRLMNDTQLAHNLAEEGYRDANTQYTASHYQARIIDVCTKIL